MDREQALNIVKKQIDGPRYVHTLGVAKTAVKLAIKYQC